jgi:glyoxylase-like metal-dependent hydrolase (beta-lactamase superfamily II)
MTPAVNPFRHEPTGTWSYVVADPRTRLCAIIDPVLDFDAKSGRSWTGAADAIASFVRDQSLTNTWILETHAHADHLSAAPWLQAAVGGQIAIGQGIRAVQRAFRDILNLGPEFPVDGRQFDHLFADDEEFAIGSLQARAIPTPGHTSDSLSYLVGDALFTGDSIFMPDGGTARCDFPGGDAKLLYASIRRLYELPASTRVFICHDYGPGGREPRCETTIEAQRAGNIHLRDGVTEQEFVELRTRRDAGLELPTLLYPSVQFNIRGGRPPPAESNRRHYLKLPFSGPAD